MYESTKEIILTSLLKISRNGRNVTSLNVDDPDFGLAGRTPPGSPRRTTDIADPFPLTSSDPFSSPVFLSTKKWTQPSLASPLKSAPYTFSDDSLDLDDRPRKRTKFWRASGEWRYSQNSPTPLPDEANVSTPLSPTADITDNIAQLISNAEEIEHLDELVRPPKMAPVGLHIAEGEVRVPSQSLHVGPQVDDSESLSSDALGTAEMASHEERLVAYNSVPNPQKDVSATSEPPELPVDAKMRPNGIPATEDQGEAGLHVSLSLIDTSVDAVIEAEDLLKAQSPSTPISPKQKIKKITI